MRRCRAFADRCDSAASTPPSGGPGSGDGLMFPPMPTHTFASKWDDHMERPWRVRERERVRERVVDLPRGACA